MSKSSDKHSFLKFVYDFYSGMKTYEVTLVYEGDINHQIIKAFTSVTEEKLSREEESEVVQKKVYHVMVESLQNIARHAAETKINEKEKMHRGILMVSVNNAEYHVTTGNLIDNAQVGHLKDTLDHINSLDKNELDQLYKKQLKEGKISDKGGAGLGFIDIKRKTGKNLEFHFMPLPGNSTFFLFTSTIPRSR